MSIVLLIDKWVSTVEKCIVGGSMLVAAASLLAAVICRHLNIIMAGGEEIALFAIVWMTFIGTAICARQGTHIIMSAVMDSMPREKRKIMATVICLISGLFCLLLFAYGAQLTSDVFRRGQVTPALRTPLWYMYISVPIGFFLTSVYYLLGFFQNLRSKEIYMGLESSGVSPDMNQN